MKRWAKLLYLLILVFILSASFVFAQTGYKVIDMNDPEVGSADDLFWFYSGIKIDPMTDLPEGRVHLEVVGDVLANNYCLGDVCVADWADISASSPIWELLGTSIAPLDTSHGLMIGSNLQLSGNEKMVVTGDDLVVDENLRVGKELLIGEQATIIGRLTVGDVGSGVSTLFVRGGALIGSDSYNSFSMSTGTMAIEESLSIGTTTSVHQLSLTKSINLPNTTSDDTGIIFKDGVRFLHNYQGSSLHNPQNVFLGHKAGNLHVGDGTVGNIQGNNNVGIGARSLLNLTKGFKNNAIGTSALGKITTASDMVAVGYLAGHYYGSGYSSLTIGKQSVFIGSETRAASNNSINEIVIGYGATGAGNNSVVLGNDEIVQTVLKGKVSIGTTSDSHQLTIDGQIYSSGGLCLAGDCVADWNELSGGGGPGVSHWQLNGDYLTASSSDWSVGIGTSSPSAKLEVAGDIKATSYCLGNNCISQWGSGSGEVASVADDGNSTLVINPVTGEVKAALNLSNPNHWLARQTFSQSLGIGTSSPSTKLQLYDTSSGPIITLSGQDGNYRGLAIKDIAGLEKWFMGNNNSDHFVIRRNGSFNDLKIDSSGNVAMGTTTVSGYITAPRFCLGTSCIDTWPTGGGGGVSSVSNSDGSLSIPTTAGHVVASLNLDKVNNWTAQQTFNQYVGIGTSSPNRHLHIYDISGTGVALNAEIDLQSVAGANRHWSMYVERDDNSLRLWGGDNRLSILRNGKVGIGTTSPSVALEVLGNIIANEPSSTSHVATKNYVDSVKINWNKLINFPVACPHGEFVNAIGSSLTCASISVPQSLWSYSQNGSDIYTDQRVGIKTNNPNYDLDVNGSASFSSSITVPSPTADVHAVNKGYVDSRLYWAGLDGEHIKNINHGTVFIGNTGNNTSRSKLSVSGGINSELGYYLGNVNVISSSGLIKAAAGSLAAPSFSFLSDAKLGMYSPHNGVINFVGDARNIMQLNASGRVGIGTIEPQVKLHIREDAAVVTDFDESVLLAIEGENSKLDIISNTGSSLSLRNPFSEFIIKHANFNINQHLAHRAILGFKSPLSFGAILFEDKIGVNLDSYDSLVEADLHVNGVIRGAYQSSDGSGGITINIKLKESSGNFCCLHIKDGIVIGTSCSPDPSCASGGGAVID